MNTQEKTKIIQAAIEARGRAYVPYSHFSVGAALLTKDGEIIQGCNVENLSYPAGLCAERTAIFSAVAKGCRQFEAIAVSGGNEGQAPEDFCMPCGMCLQVMNEFCSPDFLVLIVKNEQEVREYRLGELLPYAFDSLK